MLKNKMMCSTLLLTALCLGAAERAQAYCDNGAMYPEYAWIESITSEDVSYVTGAPHWLPDLDVPPPYPGYSNHTGLNFDLTVQTGKLVTLVPGGPLADYPMHWQAWIDFDSDGEFGPMDQLVSQTVTGPFSFHLDSYAMRLLEDRATRLRVSMRAFEAAPKCGPFDVGEVEDYTLNFLFNEDVVHRVPEEYYSIQDAIDHAYPNFIVLVNDGVYPESVIIDMPLTLQSVNGSDFTTVTGAPDRPAIWVRDGENVVVQGFDLSGARNSQVPSLEYDARFDGGLVRDINCGINPNGNQNEINVLIRSDGVTVDGVQCAARGEVGILVRGARNTRLINNSLQQHRYGIAVINGDNTWIADNEMQLNRVEGLRVLGSDNVSVLNNHIHDNQYQDFVTGTGVRVGNSSNARIEGNQILDNHGHGLRLDDSDDAVVINNTMIGSGVQGVHLTGSNAVQIIDNEILANSRYGLLLHDSEAVLLENNRINGNASRGLYLSELINSQLLGNDLQENHRVLLMLNSTGNEISRNTVQLSAPAADLCQLTFEESSGNRWWLNAFLMPPEAEFCHDSMSSNDWHSTPLNYDYLGASFSGVLGNYFIHGDHSDADGDGVADTAQTLPGTAIPAPYALSDVPDEYEVQ